MPQSIWLVLGDIGLFMAASVLVFEMMMLIIICSVHQDNDTPYVPKRKQPPLTLQHLIQPLIPVRKWMWKQVDIFVHGLEVTSRRRQFPLLCKSIRSKTKQQRALMSDMVAYTTQLLRRKATQMGKPTISNTTPRT